MDKRWNAWVARCLALAAISIILVSCGGQGTSEPEIAEVPPAVEEVEIAQAEPVIDEAEMKAKATVILAAADLADGTADKIISKCPGCGLKMEGSAENALQFGEYEMHFCQAACKTNFEEKTMENVLAMNIPEE